MSITPKEYEYLEKRLEELFKEQRSLQAKLDRVTKERQRVEKKLKEPIIEG